MAMRQLLPSMNIERMDKIVEAFNGGDIEKTKKLLKEEKFGDGEIDKKVRGLVNDAEGGVKTEAEQVKTALKEEAKEILSKLTAISKHTGATETNTAFLSRISNKIAPE